MDSHFDFIDNAQTDLFGEILSRRSPALFERLQQGGSVSRSDAEEVMSALAKELTNHFDDEWEPTSHGREVSAILAKFNAARISEWP